MFGELLQPETFEFFARYVLSGFLIIIVANSFVLGRKPRPAEAALEIVLYSLLNQLCWFSLTTLVSFLAHWAGLGTWTIPKELLLYLQVLLLPVLIGVLLGLGLRRRWLRPVLRALSLPIVDPYPRAYDHVFAEFVGEAFVIVAYADGKNVFGFYGLASRAGRDPEHGEIYLQEIYDVDEAGNWTSYEPPRSALISLDGVRAIEFIPLDQVKETGDGKKADR